MIARDSKIVLVMALAMGVSAAACNNPFQNDLRRQKPPKEQAEFISKKIIEEDKKKDNSPAGLRRLGSLHNILGDLYLEQELWSPAVEHFEKALGYGNTKATTNYSLGLAFANRGKGSDSREDFERAETCYRRAIEQDPKLFQATYALAILLFYHRDNRDAALELITEVVAKNPKYYPARFAQGRFLYELNEPTKALAVYEALNDDLQKINDSQLRREYLATCRENITRIMQEESGRKARGPKKR